MTNMLLLFIFVIANLAFASTKISNNDRQSWCNNFTVQITNEEIDVAKMIFNIEGKNTSIPIAMLANKFNLSDGNLSKYLYDDNFKDSINGCPVLSQFYHLARMRGQKVKSSLQQT